jgi:hypothetical protein
MEVTHMDLFMVSGWPCLLNELYSDLLLESFHIYCCFKDFTRSYAVCPYHYFLTQHILFHFRIISTINQAPIQPYKCIILFNSVICYAVAVQLKDV